MGTKYEVDTRDKILFIEEVNEPIYKIDRMLTTLALAGKFNHCRGVILGTFTGCEREKKAYEGGFDLPLEDVIENTIVRSASLSFTTSRQDTASRSQLSAWNTGKIDADLKQVVFMESGVI